MKRFMLDTSAVGQLEEEGTDPSVLGAANAEFYITHVQEDELRNITDAQFRKEMMKLLNTVRDRDVPTDSFVWDVSRWGRAKWGASTPMTTIRKELRDDDGNELRDALIAGIAVTEGMTLVTHDGELRDAMLKHYQNQVWTMERFLRWVRSQ